MDFGLILGGLWKVSVRIFGNVFGAIWGMLLMFTASRLLPAGTLNYIGACC